MLFEEDENYSELQEDKYSNEFIFNLFKFLVLGGAMCQYDLDVTEYLETTKALYKDLIKVAKDDDTGEIKSVSQVFRVNTYKTKDGEQLPCGKEHTQCFLYILVDPMSWHVTIFQNRWTPSW